MGVENADRRDANRILSTVLEGPDSVPEGHLDRALDLLGSDAERVRIGAAWAFGIVAADSPSRILPYVSDIAEKLDDPTAGAAATRALTYVSQSNPEAVEHELQTLEEPVAQQAREALWGRFASRTVVETRQNNGREESESMGSVDGDHWGWVGGAATAAGSYDADSIPNRRRPPTESPVDPPTVEYSYDRYTPSDTIYRGETIQTFKVVYRTPGDRINPGLFKRFESPDESFPSTFDRRIGMWQSIDDHEAILPVIDWGVDPGPWIVTAYEDSTGVDDLGPNRLEATVWTLKQIADALLFAHAAGVIHGGLTPGSIVRTSIISEPDAWRYPRVTDWGYVSLLRDGAVPEAIPEQYLAPEHLDPASFGSVDGTTDVYGFGVLVHQALFGRPPAAGGGDRTRSTDLEDVLPGLESFLRCCLADRKPERFETVAKMASAFEGVTEGFDG